MNDKKQKNGKFRVKDILSNQYVERLFVSVIISSPVCVPTFLYGVGLPMPFDFSIMSILIAFNYIILKGN